MSRVITVNKSLKDEKLTDLFAQMTGVKSADPRIIIPKYNEIRKAGDIIIKTLEKFGANEKMRTSFSAFRENFDEILEYAKSLRLALQYSVLTEEQVTEANIHVLYKACKECREVRSISVMCARLRKDLPYIEDLNMAFISDQADGIYSPLPFTNLNFYNLWTEISDIETGADKIKEYVLKVLKKLMEKSYEIQNIIVSPDIDIEEFSEVLVEAIDKARGMLPRCKDAFDKIKEAVGTLKSNFNNYYREFMISKKPNSILEGFVSDVAKSHKHNSRLKWQFMQIVNFYRKHSAGRIAKDSTLNHIFDTLDDNLDQLDQATKDEKSIKKTDETKDEEEEKDETKDLIFGLHHIGIIEEEGKAFILGVEEAQYLSFIDQHYKFSDKSKEEFLKAIETHVSNIDKTAAIESQGIYRIRIANDISEDKMIAYIRKHF